MNRYRRRFLLTVFVLTGLAMSLPISAQTAPGSAALSEAVTVYLHTDAVLTAGEYTLGEIASVHTSDPIRSQFFRQLPLGPSPERPTLLPVSNIRERIAATEAEAAVVGARVAILPAAVIPEDQRWFYAALLSFLEAQDTYKQGRIEIEMLSTPLVLEGSIGMGADHGGLASGWEDRIRFETHRSPYSSGFRATLSSGAIPAGTMQITYRILAAGGSFGSGSGSLEGSFRIWVHHFLPLAHATQDIRADQILQEGSIVFREEDVSLIQSGFIVQGEEIRGYKTLSSHMRGDRIDGRRLQRVLAVRAGDRVLITFSRPGLWITLPGRSFRSGSVGDIVDVQPASTSKRFQAKITAPGEVLVESR
jgi:flagella basal body P-ring formation protein FlgA